MITSINWVSHTKRTLLLTCNGEWLWEEFYNAWDICMHMASREPYPVNIIIDATCSSGFPAGTPGQFLSMTIGQSLNVRWMVIVRDDPIVAAMATLLQYYRGKFAQRYFHAAAIVEAIAQCEFDFNK